MYPKWIRNWSLRNLYLLSHPHLCKWLLHLSAQSPKPETWVILQMCPFSQLTQPIRDDLHMLCPLGKSHVRILSPPPRQAAYWPWAPALAHCNSGLGGLPTPLPCLWSCQIFVHNHRKEIHHEICFLFLLLLNHKITKRNSQISCACIWSKILLDSGLRFSLSWLYT